MCGIDAAGPAEHRPHGAAEVDVGVVVLDESGGPCRVERFGVGDGTNPCVLLKPINFLGG